MLCLSVRMCLCLCRSPAALWPSYFSRKASRGCVGLCVSFSLTMTALYVCQLTCVGVVCGVREQGAWRDMPSPGRIRLSLVSREKY
mmetsp:Transcript_16717/g.47613  ORF Transcript_16717/g.47613 Transcript_16717/m.47613 type:complete len:86 (-) Transcript_16717:103-360(-)